MPHLQIHLPLIAILVVLVVMNQKTQMKKIMTFSSTSVEDSDRYLM